MASTPALYRRGRIWWVRYYRNGEPVRESLHTTDKDIAQRERHAIETDLLSPHRRTEEPQNPTIEVFWGKYTRWAKDEKRDRSIETANYAWDQMLELVSPQRIGDITREDIEAFKRWRRKCGNGKQTVNNKLRDIRAIIQRGITSGWYTGDNPVDSVSRFKIPKREKTRAQFHKKEEVRHLLKEARKRDRRLETDKDRELDYRLEWVVLLGVRAGFRKIEIAESRWEWLDFDPKEPLVHVQAHEGFEIKDNQDRTIPMNKEIYRAMHPHRREFGYIFESGRKSKDKCRYRFDPKKSLDAALAAAGLRLDEPFQRLRETFGSLLVQANVSIYKVCEWLGHSSVDVTREHYAALMAYDSDINRL